MWQVYKLLFYIELHLTYMVYSGRIFVEYRTGRYERMKRLLAVLACLFLLCGCADGSTGGVLPDRGETTAWEEEEETAEPMEELMKISTWVLDPALEGKGHWAYADLKTHQLRGYWVPNEGEPSVQESKVFREQCLQVGEVYIMAPLSYSGANLNFTIDFDGVVTVEKTDPADNSILIDFESNLSNQWTGEKVISRNGPCTLNVYPVGKDLTVEGVGLLDLYDTVAEKEYLLTVRGYELDGTLMTTVKIKLITLEDPVYPYEEIRRDSHGYGELYSVGEKRTRFCSVELVSYEYSDQYKMMMTEYYKRACRIYDEKCNLRHAFCDFHEYRSSFFPLARKKGSEKRNFFGCPGDFDRCDGRFRAPP